jgi:hypothetical protein
VGFEIDILIHKNTLTFDLIDENDIKDLRNILEELFDRLKRDSSVLNKAELKESFYYPFESGSSKASICLTITVSYHAASRWLQAINIRKEF